MDFRKLSCWTLGKYISLLFFPHPLTHDYYPRHIEIMTFANIGVILSILTYLALVIIAILGIRKKKILSFAILYFLITMSIISNVVFPIGTNMSERFMFMPSLGFALAVSFLGWKYLFVKNQMIYKVLFGLVILGFSIKTITRNPV